jgi:UDP:flavonoid glycosyltransferase YjiC (YdhE family)
VLEPALQALRQTGRAGVVTTGSADPSVLGPGPKAGTPVAVERFVPYGRVLPHAGAFVTNGGWTGVLLALASGVPVVQVGRTEEKADIGRRVAWAGAGVHLSGPGRGGRRLRAALDAVLEDPRYAEGAARLSRALSLHDPPSQGADLIVRLQA